MGERRPVFHHEHTLAPHRIGIVTRDLRVRLDHDGLGVDLRDRPLELADLLRVRGIHLVDQDDAGRPEVGLPGVVPELVSDTERIHQRDPHRGAVERDVVVATVPQQHVAFGLRLFEDRSVVDARIDDGPRHDVRLVLLAFLDRALVTVQVRELGIPLHALRGQIPVRHRVPHGDDALARRLEGLRDRAGGLRLPDARAHRRHRDGRDGRLQHGRVRSEEDEVRSGRQRRGGLVHHLVMAHVRVAEHDVIDPQLADQPDELGLVVDLDPVRVPLACQRRRISAVVDERDLGRRERDHFRVGIIAIDDVEVVEVPPCGSHDQDATRHAGDPFRWRSSDAREGRPGPATGPALRGVMLLEPALRSHRSERSREVRNRDPPPIVGSSPQQQPSRGRPELRVLVVR